MSAPRRTSPIRAPRRQRIVCLTAYVLVGIVGAVAILGSLTGGGL